MKNEINFAIVFKIIVKWIAKYIFMCIFLSFIYYLPLVCLCWCDFVRFISFQLMHALSMCAIWASVIANNVRISEKNRMEMIFCFWFLVSFSHKSNAKRNWWNRWFSVVFVSVCRFLAVVVAFVAWKKEEIQWKLSRHTVHLVAHICIITSSSALLSRSNSVSITNEIYDTLFSSFFSSSSSQ